MRNVELPGECQLRVSCRFLLEGGLGQAHSEAVNLSRRIEEKQMFFSKYDREAIVNRIRVCKEKNLTCPMIDWNIDIMLWVYKRRLEERATSN